MPKLFCPECGQPNVYGDVKPHFCGFCQSSLTVQAGSNPAFANERPTGRKRIGGRGRVPIAPQYDDDEDDDEDDDGFESDGTMPDIRKLDLEITMDEPYRETVGQVWGSGGGDGPIRKKPKRINKTEVLQTLKDRIFKRTNLDLNPNE